VPTGLHSPDCPQFHRRANPVVPKISIRRGIL
jgi:hypothetical protein